MSKKTKKQAVLLIHGIGEQKPMESLRNFVKAVWITDKSVQRAGDNADALWSKPYKSSHSFDLRRLATGKNKDGVETDFFEMYWAHLMRGNTAEQVFRWIKLLMWRNPDSVPSQLKSTFWLLWSVFLVWLLCSLWVGFVRDDVSVGLTIAASLPITMFLLSAVLTKATNFIGDAARYLDPSPENVAKRDEIRKLGVDILKTLHEDDYERIVVVGHSLGSIIGYEVLYHTWVTLRDETTFDSKKSDALNNIEKFVSAASSQGSAVKAFEKQYRLLQEELFTQMRTQGFSWRVTDFVTLGSPLAHADVLMANELKDLKYKLSERELAECPPTLERKGQLSGFSYQLDSTQRKLHFAAHFGPTKWTNIYFPAKRILWGDVVGGPIKHVFGDGIKDVEVTTDIRNNIFSHTLYWSPDKEGSYELQHIERLRKAINL